jgi:hypothetical protein
LFNGELDDARPLTEGKGIDKTVLSAALDRA